MGNKISRETRKYIYAVAIAFVPVAVYFGWIDIEASALILPLLLAVLNLTPKDVEPEEDHGGETVDMVTGEVDNVEPTDVGKHGIPEHAVIPVEEQPITN